MVLRFVEFSSPLRYENKSVAHHPADSGRVSWPRMVERRGFTLRMSEPTHFIHELPLKEEFDFIRFRDTFIHFVIHMDSFLPSI